MGKPKRRKPPEMPYWWWLGQDSCWFCKTRSACSNCADAHRIFNMNQRNSLIFIGKTSMWWLKMWTVGTGLHPHITT